MIVSPEEIRKIVEQVADVGDGWSNSAPFADLDLDSLDIMEVLLGVQELTDFEVPDADIEKVQSVDQLVSYMKDKPGS